MTGFVKALFHNGSGNNQRQNGCHKNNSRFHTETGQAKQATGGVRGGNSVRHGLGDSLLHAIHRRDSGHFLAGRHGGRAYIAGQIFRLSCGLTIAFRKIPGPLPLGKLVGEGEDSAPLAAGQPMNGHATLFLPASNGSLVAPEESGNFLPGTQALPGRWGIWVLHILKCPVNGRMGLFGARSRPLQAG